MKKRLAFLFALLVIALAACAKEPEQTQANPESAPEAVAETAETEKAPDQAKAKNPEKFEGAYIEEDASGKDTYMEAVIEGDKITVNWNMSGGETIALYWAGTFEQPQGRDDYTFDSVNDKEKTQFAFLASSDETKPMTVSGGKISFSVTAMGVTTTVHLIPGAEG